MTAAVKDNDGSGKKRKEIPSGEAFHDIGNGKALPSSIPRDLYFQEKRMRQEILNPSLIPHSISENDRQWTRTRMKKKIIASFGLFPLFV